MLMVVGVVLALLGAGATSRRACLQAGSRSRYVELCLAGHDATRRDAHVTAVQAQSDAAYEHRDVVFAEAGIGARGTRLGTGEARLDAFEQCSSIKAQRPRVCVEHLSGERHDYSFPRSRRASG
jgi:hypothetical protein